MVNLKNGPVKYIAALETEVAHAYKHGHLRKIYQGGA